MVTLCIRYETNLATVNLERVKSSNLKQLPDEQLYLAGHRVKVYRVSLAVDLTATKRLFFLIVLEAGIL